jgi:hypothetical protein
MSRLLQLRDDSFQGRKRLIFPHQSPALAIVSRFGNKREGSPGSGRRLEQKMQTQKGFPCFCGEKKSGNKLCVLGRLVKGISGTDL